MKPRRQDEFYHPVDRHGVVHDYSHSRINRTVCGVSVREAPAKHLAILTKNDPLCEACQHGGTALRPPSYVPGQHTEPRTTDLDYWLNMAVEQGTEPFTVESAVRHIAEIVDLTGNVSSKLYCTVHPDRSFTLGYDEGDIENIYYSPIEERWVSRDES